MTTTNNLGITLIDQNMSAKEIAINEALLMLDAFLNTGAKSKSTATPPATPAAGDLYIIPSGATGSWSGHGNHIACYQTGRGWVIVPPREGAQLWVSDIDTLYAYDGTAWIPNNSGLGSSPTTFGINTTADTTNRLAVKSTAVLFDHAGAGSQVKVNKSTAADTASHLFQTGYSGRAEFGLTGDDDFHLKVSADGSVWNEALVCKKSTGLLNAKKRIDADAGISFNSGASVLTNYDEGTFTPVLVGTTTAGVGTYTAQFGFYTRIGNRVDYQISISWTAHTGTGAGRINGLPFTSRSGTVSPAAIYNINYATPASTYLTVCVENTTNYMPLVYVTLSSGAVAAAPIDSSAALFIQGSYFI